MAALLVALRTAVAPRTTRNAIATVVAGLAIAAVEMTCPHSFCARRLLLGINLQHNSGDLSPIGPFFVCIK